MQRQSNSGDFVRCFVIQKNNFDLSSTTSFKRKPNLFSGNNFPVRCRVDNRNLIKCSQKLLRFLDLFLGISYDRYGRHLQRVDGDTLNCLRIPKHLHKLTFGCPFFHPYFKNLRHAR